MSLPSKTFHFCISKNSPSFHPRELKESLYGGITCNLTLSVALKHKQKQLRVFSPSLLISFRFPPFSGLLSFIFSKKNVVTVHIPDTALSGLLLWGISVDYLVFGEIIGLEKEVLSLLLCSVWNEFVLGIKS